MEIEYTPIPLRMSLRDYFAGQALIGILSNPGTHGDIAEHVNLLTESAYNIATEMVKERESRQ